ncbi:MAG: DNA methyltransferase [Methanocellales archaeon]
MVQIKLDNTQDEDWTFKEANTHEYTHGLHPYPARMCPQIARKLIKLYSKPKDIIFDPFCGSGTVLVEAKLAGRNGIGVDLNPFGILLSEVKTMQIDPIILKKNINNFLDNVRPLQIESKRKNVSFEVPRFFNIEFWFKEYVIRDLVVVKKCIDEITDPNVKKFLLVCFSLLVRKTSNTRNGEFKLYRYSKEKLNNHNPDVLQTLIQILKEAYRSMNQFYIKADKTVFTSLLCCDARKVPIASETMDLLVTSPPYGDSRTTVAYGQFSRLPLQWLGYKDKEVSSIDRKCLGGINNGKYNFDLNSITLNEVVSKIMNKDEKRGNEVGIFFYDLNDCLKEMFRLMKPNSYTCIVIGNRMVKGVRIPTNLIISELCQEIGFSFVKNISRQIPYKTMPKENAPTNIPGEKCETMCEENIVILRK